MHSASNLNHMLFAAINKLLAHFSSNVWPLIGWVSRVHLNHSHQPSTTLWRNLDNRKYNRIKRKGLIGESCPNWRFLKTVVKLTALCFRLHKHLILISFLSWRWFWISLFDFSLFCLFTAFSIEGSGISFVDLFHLVAFYCVSR